MRYLLSVLLALAVAGCTKSVAQKQREADQCWLEYGSGRMDTCLIADHGWDSTSAYVAKIRRQNKGE